MPVCNWISQDGFGAFDERNEPVCHSKSAPGPISGDLPFTSSHETRHALLEHVPVEPGIEIFVEQRFLKVTAECKQWGEHG